MAGRDYSNAEKLVAVVEAWAKPLVTQLPSPYSMLAPMVGPLICEYLKKIPDESIPRIANSVIDNAVSQGSVKLWQVTLDINDLTQLQRLVKLNLPCESEQNGYEVKLK